MQRHVLSRLVQPSAPRRRRGGRLARVVPTASDGRAEDRSRAVEILIVAAVYPSGRCAAGARVESAPVFLFDLRDDAFLTPVRSVFSAKSRGANCCAGPDKCSDSAGAVASLEVPYSER